MAVCLETPQIVFKITKYKRCVSDWMISVKHLKELRVRAGLSQQQLSEELDISQQRLSKLEKEEVLAKEDVILKIAGFFDVKADYLLEDTMASEINEFAPYYADDVDEQLNTLIQKASEEEKIVYLNVLRAVSMGKKVL